DIVVEEIEPAPAVDRGLDQPLAVGLAGDVAAVSRGRAAIRFDHLDGAFGKLDVAVGDQHPRDGAGQQDCRGTAVADAYARSTPTAVHRHLAGKTGVLFCPHVVPSRSILSCFLTTIPTGAVGEKAARPAPMSLTSHGIACRRTKRRCVRLGSVWNRL